MPPADLATVAVANGGPFTIAVIPDTQYLFDQDRSNADVLAGSLQWIATTRAITTSSSWPTSAT